MTDTPKPRGKLDAELHAQTDYLRTLLRLDEPKPDGIHITAEQADGLAKAFTALARAFREAEGISFELEFRLAKKAA